MGWGLKCVCGGLCSRRRDNSPQPAWSPPAIGRTGARLPGTRAQVWTQAGAVHPRPGCSPVGAGARQRVVAASCPWGAAGIIADAQDPELVAGLAARVESPAGPQREVVAPLGEVGRDRGVLHLLWGRELLGG